MLLPPRIKTIGGSVLLVLALVALAFVLPEDWTGLLTKILIMALFATSLNLELGYAGMMPLGQAMFMGISAYAYTILFVKAAVPLGLAALGSLGISLIANIVIGFLCLRGEEMTFGLLHLSFNILFFTISNKWLAIGGDAGLAGAIRPEFLTGSLSFNLFVLGVVVLCYVIMRIIVGSKFFKIAQGLRENEERLKFLGINTRRFRLAVFVISGFFTSVAGILLAMQNGGAFPAYLNALLSAQGLMMCLIGGMATFMGPSIGAAITTIIITEISNYIYLWQGILGIIIIGCVIVFRGGILGGRQARKRPSSHREIVAGEPEEPSG
jgi:branched-chain amino acid transport system permease protein